MPFENALVDGVHFWKIVKVFQEYRGFQNLREVGSRFLQHGSEVLEDLFRLCFDLCTDHFHGGGVEWNLSRAENQVAVNESLGVGTNGLGRFFSVNEFHGGLLFHGVVARDASHAPHAQGFTSIPPWV